MQPPIKQRQLLAYLTIFVAAPIITFVFGSLLDNMFELPLFPIFPVNLFTGITIMVIGLNLGIKSTRQLYQHGRGLPWGEVSHEVETQRVVTAGIYAYSRNPMMLGYSMLPVGLGLMFQSIGMIVSLTPGVLVLNFFIVKKIEEPRLIERFGEEYIRYKSQTPFLFPDWIKLFKDYLIPYVKKNWSQVGFSLLAELSLFITALVIDAQFPLSFFSPSILLSDIIFTAILVLVIIVCLTPKYSRSASLGERRGAYISAHVLGDSFEKRTVSFAGKVFCSGCTGLVIGAVSALFGQVTGYYFFDLTTGFWLGAMLVYLGLAQNYIDLGSGWVNLLLNLVIVLGDWLMFYAIRSMGLSFLVLVYFLAASVLWIYVCARA